VKLAREKAVKLIILQLFSWRPLQQPRSHAVYTVCLISIVVPSALPQQS